MTERPASLRTVRDTVTPNIEHAVLKALAKLPSDRWGSTEKFAEALIRIASAHADSDLAAPDGRTLFYRAQQIEANSWMVHRTLCTLEGFRSRAYVNPPRWRDVGGRLSELAHSRSIRVA